MRTLEQGQEHTLEMKAGASFNIEAVYQTNTGTELDPIWTPVNITDWTSELAVVNEYGDPAIISFTEVAGDPDGQIVIDGLAGKAVANFYPAGTAKLTGRAYFDWYLRNGPNVAVPLLGGPVILKRSAL